MQGWSQGDQGGRLRCHMDKNPVKQGKVLVTRNQRQDREGDPNRDFLSMAQCISNEEES